MRVTTSLAEKLGAAAAKARGAGDPNSTVVPQRQDSRAFVPFHSMKIFGHIYMAYGIGKTEMS